MHGMFEAVYIQGKIQDALIRVRFRQTRSGSASQASQVEKPREESEARIKWQEKVFAHGDTSLLQKLTRSRGDSERARVLREHVESSTSQTVSTLVHEDLCIPPSAASVSKAADHPLARGVSTAWKHERLPQKVQAPVSGTCMAIAVDNHLAAMLRVTDDGRQLFSNPKLGKEFLLQTTDGSEYMLCIWLDHDPSADADAEQAEHDNNTTNGTAARDDGDTLNAQAGPSSRWRSHVREANVHRSAPPRGLTPPPTPSADVHISLELAHCASFNAKRIFVRWLVCWSLQHWRWHGDPPDEQRSPSGGAPTLLRGATQVASPYISSSKKGHDANDMRVFSTCASLPEVNLRSVGRLDTMPSRSFPHLLLAVHWMDAWGRTGIAGYGKLSLGMQCPVGDSTHRVTTWKPRASNTQKMKERLVGGSKALSDARVLISSEFGSLHGASTESDGDVLVRVGKKMHERKDRTRREHEHREERLRTLWRTSMESGLLPKADRKGIAVARPQPRDYQHQGRQAVNAISSPQKQQSTVSTVPLD